MASIEDDPKNHIAWLRDDYSDEIPTSLTISSSENNRFKVRKGWWQGVIGDLSNLIEDGQISDPELLKGASEFIKIHSARFKKEWKLGGRTPTTRDQINEANDIIDRVLGRK